MSKRFLVTGGAGFLGSNLCRRLIQIGEVICVDDFSTGATENIEDLMDFEKFKLVRANVEEELDFECSFIFNLACPASPIHYQKDPLKTIKTNVFGTFNVLELATRNACPVFQASTSEVYGDPLQHPQHESYFGNVNPIGIRSCYDEGKRCAESIFFDYARSFQLEVKVARIFNTYGPGMGVDDGRVVSNFIVQALRNSPLSVYGDGLQTRSFCFVDDLIDGFLAFASSPGRVCGPINLGSEAEFNMLELAKEVCRAAGVEERIEFFPMPEDDPTVRRPDLSNAKQLLNWEPKVSLADGLDKTVQYFREKLL